MAEIYPGIRDNYNYDDDWPSDDYEANKQPLISTVGTSSNPTITANGTGTPNIASYIPSPERQEQAIITWQHNEMMELRDNLAAAYCQIDDLRGEIRTLQNKMADLYMLRHADLYMLRHTVTTLKDIINTHIAETPLTIKREDL